MKIRELLGEDTGDKSFDDKMKAMTQVKDQKVTERELNAILRSAERQIDHNARYKNIDTDIPSKRVFWVTQATNGKGESQKAADDIAHVFTKSGLVGWKIHVVVRDDWDGDWDSKVWKIAES